MNSLFACVIPTEAGRSGRLQGKDCSYNPIAFPPSMEVSVGGSVMQDAYMDVSGTATRMWAVDCDGIMQSRVVPGANTEQLPRNLKAESFGIQDLGNTLSLQSSYLDSNKI